MINNRPADLLSKKKKKVLFLGYDKTETKIIDKLIDANCDVTQSKKKINSFNFDLIISFGYKLVIKKDFLIKSKCPIINIHISYLPYNRGYYPNFWAFFENTPSGVTIHLVDEGIDTGPILFQKMVNFDNGEKTFFDTYIRLKQEAEKLFCDNIEKIINNIWVPKTQKSGGSHHYKKDLPKEFSGWNSDIKDEINRLNKLYKKNYV